MNQGIQFLIPTGAPAGRPEGAMPGGQGASGPPGAFRSMLLSALLGEAAGKPQVQLPAVGPVLVPAVPPEGVAAGGPAETFVPVDALLSGAEGPVPSATPQAQPTTESQRPQAPPLNRPAAAVLAALLMEAGAPVEGEPPEPLPDTGEAATQETVSVLTSAEAFAQMGAATSQAPVPAPAPQLLHPAPQPRPDHVQAAVTPAEPSTAQLEAFVQKATAMVEGTHAQPEPHADPDKPRFADLLKLVAEAEGAPQQAQAPQTSADAQPQSRHQGEAPHQAAGEVKFQAPQPTAAERPEPVATVDSAAEPTHASVEVKPHHPVSEPAEVAPTESKPPVQPEPVLRQVTRFVKVMVESERSEVRLNLHPEELGTIVVKLVLEGGSVKAHLTAQDAAVKHVLETNLDQLRTRFANQGITVNEVHVAVGDNGSSFSQPQHSQHGGRQEQQQSQSRSGHAPASQHEEPQPAKQAQSPAPWTRRWTGSRINSLA